MFNNKIACVFNYPSHYRINIYTKMEKEFNCVFYFGKIKKSNILKLNYKEFINKPIELDLIKFFNFKWFKGTFSIFLDSNNKYVFIGDPSYLSVWFFLLFGRFFGKKTFLWSHGWYGNEKLLKKLVKKLFFKLSDGTFLYGNHAKKLMIEHGINENKLHVIYNSLDYDKQIQLRNNIKKTDIYTSKFINEEKTIVFIGRITKVKKLDFILFFKHKLKEIGEHINVVFIGDGDEKKYLMSICKKLKFEETVWFYGACYNEKKISELIYNADLCLSPGNVGLTAVHSLMYGTPVFTHNDFSKQMPEFEAVKSGETGEFYKKNNLDDLIKFYFKWFNDKNYNRDLIRKRCYKTIDQYYNPNYQMKVMKKQLSN